MKTCYLCNTNRPISDFYKDRSRPGGLSSRCKACDKQKVSHYFRTDNGKLTKKRYVQSPKGRIAKQRDDRKYLQTEGGRKHIYANVIKYNKTPKGRICKQQAARRRRERKYNLDLELTSQDITLIHNRFHDSCFNCGIKEKLEIDHHNPLSNGYGLSIDNAVLLCRSCNASKRDKSPEDFYSLNQLQQLEFLLRL